MRKVMMTLAAVSAALFVAPAAQAQNLFGDGLTGKKLEKAIKAAEQHPLGSRENPIRVNMPPGERRYLSKLRCPDGEQPQFERAGSVGIGPYGNILDLYPVRCNGQEPVEVYMDMYFPENETRPVPGFTIVE